MTGPRSWLASPLQLASWSTLALVRESWSPSQSLLAWVWVLAYRSLASTDYAGFAHRGSATALDLAHPYWAARPTACHRHHASAGCRGKPPTSCYREKSRIVRRRHRCKG